MRKTRRGPGVLLFLSLMAGLSRADDSPNTTVADYRLQLALEPATQTLRVRAQLKGLPCSNDRLVLHLNRLFTLDVIEVDGQPILPVLDPPDVPPFWLSAARNIALPCPQQSVTLQYHGTGALSRDGRNQVSTELIELSLYGAWYPISTLDQRFRWTLTVPLSANTRFTTNAKTVRALARGKGATVWQLSQPAPDRDIAIVGSPLFVSKTVSAASAQVQTFVAKDRPETARQRAFTLGHFAAEGLQALIEDWGRPTPDGARVQASLVFSRRGGPLSYARLPMVVTPQTVLDAPADADRPVELNVLHELAHFWSRARTAEDDWLNEGLAEYLALRQFAHSGRAAEAEAVRSRYRALASKAGTRHSILQSGDADAETVNRYFKPALLFDALERQASPDAMQAFLRAALAPATTLTTAKIQALAAEHLGPTAAGTLRQCLAGLDWPAICGGEEVRGSWRGIDVISSFGPQRQPAEANAAAADCQWKAWSSSSVAPCRLLHCPPPRSRRWPTARISG